MNRDLKGQEVLEVALVSALVFFAGLFVVLAFGQNISKIFSESASGQEKTVAQFDLTDPGIALPGPNVGGITVTIPTSDGGTGDITFPNPDYYLSETITTSGAAGFTTEIGNYTQDLSEVIEQISALTGNNPNINKLAQIIADTGNAEIAYNENLDSENNPDLLNLDPESGSLIDDINAIIKNVDDSIVQLNDEGSSIPNFSNILTSLDQYSYAKELESTLTDILNDPSIPQETKDVLSLITNQVQGLADNVTYTVDSALYSNVASTFSSKIDPAISVDTSTSSLILSSSSLTSSPTVTSSTINTNLTTASTPSEQAIAFIDTIKIINSNPAISNDFMSKLTVEEKTNISNLARSLNIDIIMPLDTVIDTSLAAQAACSSSGGSWDGSACN